MGDNDALWRFSLDVPNRSPIGEAVSNVKTVEKALDIFDGLWERQGVFEDEIKPPGFDDAVRDAWDSIIENWEIDYE